MCFPIVPAWFPLGALTFQGVVALCVLLFCFTPLWHVTWGLKADIGGPEARIQTQETPRLLMEGLNARREETRRLLGAIKTLPTPDTPSFVITSLREMISSSGMQSSHFVPAAETVMEENHIRLDGIFSGPPDSSRCLVLLLSEQPWLSGMEFLNVTPSDALPTYSPGIWATFMQQANTLRH